MGKIDQNMMLKGYLQDFIAGDDSRFEVFYKESYSALYVYGRQIFSDNELLKDELQNFYLHLYQHPKKFLPEGLILPYLFRSFRHHLLRAQKLEHRQKVKMHPITQWKDSPETEFCRKESQQIENQQVQRLLQELSPREREIIYLRYFQNLEAKEVAHILAIQHQVVRNLAYRALGKLRKKYVNRHQFLQHLEWMTSLLAFCYFSLFS